MTDQINLHELDNRDAARLLELADQVPAAATAALEKYRALVTEIHQLATAGVTNASIYMRNEKYMYLIHPTQPDGSRRREYIGADPNAQAAAQARLDRYARHQELTRQANRARAAINQAIYSINRILSDLEAK